MSRKDVKRGINYEKKKAAAHRGKHKGGLGNEDYERGNKKGEVKDRKDKATKPELQKLINAKHINEIDSKAGFTNPAIEYRNRYHPDVRLIQKGKEIKKSQKSKK